MTSFIESILSKFFSFERKYQWLFRVENSILWEITSFRMTKKQFHHFVMEYNHWVTLDDKPKLVEFAKVKLPKISFIEEDEEEKE